jgi:hypothetical protein
MRSRSQSVLTEHKLSIRCLPEEGLGELDRDAKCIFTGKRATHVALIGRATDGIVEGSHIVPDEM